MTDTPTTDDRVSIIATETGISTRPYHPTVSMLEQSIGHIKMAQQYILRGRPTNAARFIEYAEDALQLSSKEVKAVIELADKEIVTL